MQWTTKYGGKDKYVVGENQISGIGEEIKSRSLKK
jgi:hypothetical protein